MVWLNVEQVMNKVGSTATSNKRISIPNIAIPAVKENSKRSDAGDWDGGVVLLRLITLSLWWNIDAISLTCRFVCLSLGLSLEYCVW